MTTLSLADARFRFDLALEQSLDGPVIVEDQGRPVGVLISPETFQELSQARAREEERLDREAYDAIIGPLERGHFVELTTQDWTDLRAGIRKYPANPDLLARPQ